MEGFSLMNLFIHEALIFIALIAGIYSAARFHQCFLTVILFKEQCQRSFQAEGDRCKGKKRKMYEWLVYTAALLSMLIHLVLF